MRSNEFNLNNKKQKAQLYFVHTYCKLSRVTIGVFVCNCVYQVHAPGEAHFRQVWGNL